MDARDLRHAYAVLELTPPVDETSLKRQHRLLVRRWHPDRYQADPVGQAEATQRLRDINIAYELVAASLVADSVGSTEPSEEVPPADAADRPFSWSPERVDAIVASINRLNKWSLVPDMSVHRWFSVGAVVIYLVAAIALLPTKREINRVLDISCYFWLPLYLIWTGDRDDRGRLESGVCRIIGWLFMAAPAVVGMALWIAG